MSQNESIRKYLEDGHSITPIDALNMFGCFRLGARIADLKKQGLNIKTEIVHDNANGKHWASYRLVTNNIEISSTGEPFG